MEPLFSPTSTSSVGQDSRLDSYQTMQSILDTASTSSKQAHDEHLWFEDGSVVLESGGIFFKVYSGILARSSPVFKDMFSFPQPEAGDPSAEIVQDIAVKDAAMVVGLLRLSTKYEVPHLRHRAIQILREWYPAELATFMALPRAFLPPDEYPRHALVANAARETDVPILLPAALLLCCATASVNTLWDGLDVPTEAGTVARCDLSQMNKRALFLGRPLLAHHARTRVQSFFFYPHTDEPRDKTLRCQAPERCGSFCRIYASVYDDKEDPWMNPFYKLNWKSIRSTCCNVCAARWEKHHDEATRELWEELPKLFNLPSWDVLKEQVKNV
ncbi:hypothetical protein EIP86_006960 [Pleurotus ostreatoroseus]|nr:hypothetical protein EIP86_006960 [Pleurotus ostreatoroseus]